MKATRSTGSKAAARLLAQKQQAREDAAALVAAQATEAVGGEQQDALREAIRSTEAALARLDETIAQLAESQAVLGEQVRAGAKRGAEEMKPHTEAIREAIRRLGRS